MKRIDKFDKRTGMHLIAETEGDEKVKGMINFEGKVLVATTTGVYIVSENKTRKEENQCVK